jgi:uncharacterized protein (TIGR02453 family)
MPKDAIGAFTGFRPAAFTFFKGLAKHNDPAWFKPRKAVYETEVLAPFRALITAVSVALEEAGVPLVGDPERGMFRIYRDVRFSPDKRLYKTHAGAVLTRSANKRDPGLLYLHFEPGAARLGAGFWHPEPPLLARLRRAILDDPDGFLEMADRLAAAGHPLRSDAQASRLPRDFEPLKGSRAAEFVLWKSFTCGCPLDDAEMASARVVKRIVAFTRTVLPLLEWGWDALDDDRPPPIVIPKTVRPLPPPDF